MLGTVFVCVSDTELCLTLCSPIDCSPLSSSVHRILQARILEWVAIPFSRGSSQLRNQTQVFCIAGRFLTVWATREAPISITFRSVRVDLIFLWWNTDFDLLSYLLWGRDGWRPFQKFLPVLPHFDSSDFTGQGNNTEVMPTIKAELDIQLYNYSGCILRDWLRKWPLRGRSEPGLHFLLGPLDILILTWARKCINSDLKCNSTQNSWGFFSSRMKPWRSLWHGGAESFFLGCWFFL